MSAAPAIIRSHLKPNTRPNRMPEYSVVQPSTSSASASGMSNGMRSISAIIETLKTTKPRICGEKMYHAGIASGPRERREDHERRRGDEDGRDVEHRGVRVPWGNVLLLQQLDTVRDVLQVTRAAVGGSMGPVEGPERERPDRDHDAVSILKTAVELALDPHHRQEVDQGRPDHDDRDRDEPRDEYDEQLGGERSHPEPRPSDRVEPLRQAGQRRNQPGKRV